MRAHVLLVMATLALGSGTAALAQTPAPAVPLALAESAQAPRAVTPPAGDATLARWIDVQAATLGLVYRRVDNGLHVHTLDAMQWGPVFRARVRLDAAARYTVNLGVQGGPNFKLSWNGTGVGTQDFMHNLPVRHLYFSAAPVTGLTVQAGSLPLLRGESTEITTYDNDGYVLGERLVLAQRRRFFFDEIGVTNAFLGDYTTPSFFDRTRRADERNYRQVVATRRVAPSLAVSAEYTAHAGTHLLRQGVVVKAPSRIGLDLLRLEQYERVRPDHAYGVAIVGEKAVTSRIRVGGGFASIDTRYGPWNGDRYNVGDHVFAQVTTPLYGYVSFLGFYGRELHPAETTTNLNRVDVQVTYDALAHWKATRRR